MHPGGSSAVGEESADLLLALDLLVAADPKHLARASAGRTVTVASTSLVPTADMVRGTAGAPDLAALLAAVRERTRPGGLTAVDTVALATALFGDGIAANLIALGAAYQAGALPLQAASIARAIEVNGVAVERNQAAFRAGRLAVHDPRSCPRARRAGELRREAGPRPAGRRAGTRAAARPATARPPTGPLRRAAELTAYQDARLAARYLDLVGAAAQAEAGRTGAAGELTEAVAAGFFHLLAYKDEYEVARLHLLPEFDQALAEAAGGGRGVRYLLHPPVLRALGLKKKIAFPAPVIRPALPRAAGDAARAREPRPTRSATPGCAAPSGGSPPSTRPRCAPSVAVLSPANHAAAVELARLPLAIRGYEQIKLAAVERYEAELERLRSVLRDPGPGRR